MGDDHQPGSTPQDARPRVLVTERSRRWILRALTGASAVAVTLISRPGPARAGGGCAPTNPPSSTCSPYNCNPRQCNPVTCAPVSCAPPP